MKNISKKIKNVFTFILMTIIVFTSYGIYTLKDFTNGYKYFEINLYCKYSSVLYDVSMKNCNSESKLNILHKYVMQKVSKYNN